MLRPSWCAVKANVEAPKYQGGKSKSRPSMRTRFEISFNVKSWKNVTASFFGSQGIKRAGLLF